MYFSLFLFQQFIAISILLICCTVILTFQAIKTFKFLRVAQGLNKIYTRNSLIQSKQCSLYTSFNTNISHQLFNFIITFVNSLKNRFERSFKVFWFTRKIRLRFGMTNSINTVKNSLHTHNEFFTFNNHEYVQLITIKLQF